MNMLYKYKDAFGLRDKIGTCPNIEVGIDVTDKSPFLLNHITLGKKTKSHSQRNETPMLFRYTRKRILSIFKSCYVYS